MRWTPVAVLVVALLAAGCGGDKRPTKAEYIRQADAICTKGNAELQTAAKPFGDDPSEKQIKDFGLQIFIPNLEGQVAELRALKPPKGDDDTVKLIWDTAQKGLDRLKKDPEEFVREGTPALFQKTHALTTAYGFKVCGSTSN
jgi:hypothetical protein